MLEPDVRLVSYYSEKLGVTAPDWFNDPTWALPAIIGIDWWHTIGYTFVIMLAGLQTVPQRARRGGADRRRELVAGALERDAADDVADDLLRRR